MNEPFLILDCTYLCHRALYSTGNLSYKEVGTGVIYGFMRDIVEWMDRFQTRKIIFAFDMGNPLRKQIYSGYKEKRHSKQRTPEEQKVRSELERQIIQLRVNYLPMVGFKNVFAAEGYEGDDIIASVVEYSIGEEPAIVVSADSDLYQLLAFDGVQIFHPQQNRIVTRGVFVKEKGVKPRRWAEVKAMAGCSTDEVPGIPGVGEKTAIQFMGGHLKPESAKFRAIQTGGRIIVRNLRLVELPLKGTPRFKLQKDKLSATGWSSMCGLLGFRTLDFNPFRLKYA